MEELFALMMKELKREVTEKEGETVLTQWGPLQVVGIGTDDQGNDLILLCDEKLEEFTMQLHEWAFVTESPIDEQNET